MKTQSILQRLAVLRGELTHLHGLVIGSDSTEAYSKELFGAIQDLNEVIAHMTNASEEYKRLMLAFSP